MPGAPIAITDPRTFREAAAAPARELFELAEASLTAGTRQRADAADARLRALLATGLTEDAGALAAVLANAPSVDVARHLWRQLDVAVREAATAGTVGLVATVFAVPVVLVTGLERGDRAASIACVLDRPERLAAILADGGALGGGRTIGLANALVAADAIDVAQLPRWLARQRLPAAVADAASMADRVLEPAPCVVPTGREAVHLRFVVGTSIAGPGVDPVAGTTVGKWGMPFAAELARQLATAGASVLALPRSPQRLLGAVAQGRVAQREVSAQIFASNAIRKFRAAAGEPSAVLSAHRARDAAGGGELRLSLSSPFEQRGAEGFRCPLHPIDRAADVASMLVDLLRDCRIADIRVLSGVHADRDAATGLPLFFRPDTIPGSTPLILH